MQDPPKNRCYLKNKELFQINQYSLNKLARLKELNTQEPTIRLKQYQVSLYSSIKKKFRFGSLSPLHTVSYIKLETSKNLDPLGRTRTSAIGFSEACESIDKRSR